MIQTLREATRDIAAGFRLRDAGYALAREEIWDAHRRTTLGPAWLLINYLSLVATFALIFGSFMGAENYVAYVAVGLLVWNHINDAIGQGSTLFLKEESYIKGTVLPLSVYVLQQNLQLLIRSSYASLGCLAVLLLSGMPPSFGWIWALLGIALVLVTGPAATIVFAICGVLFPDVQFILNNALRVMMFVTPVVWTVAEGNPLQAAMYAFNPLTHFIEIVRIPILDGVFPGHSFAIAAIISLALWAAALLLLGHYRRRIVFLL